MFQRRNRLTNFQRLKELVWPQQGWRRSTLYIAHRLGRLPGTPYRVAAGFACGAAVSFTPFLGLHFVLAALLSLLLRGSILASAIGTVVGNPWTFVFFIWPVTYKIGQTLLGVDAGELQTENLTWEHFSENFFSKEFWNVIWPMTVGGVPSAVVVWFVAFVPIFTIVKQYQRARQWRIRRKASRALKQSEAAQLSEGQLGKQA